MRLAATALLLLVLTACGGEEAADKPPRSPSSTSTTAPATTAVVDECTKLARTWAVAARDLKGRLLLMLPDRVEESTKAMTSATDQMEIEGCTSPAREAALMGNYQAALANAQMMVCVNDAADACGKAADTWASAGEPLVNKVRSLTDMD